MESKFKRITLFVKPHTKLPNIAIVVSWPAKLNWNILKCLKNHRRAQSIQTSVGDRKYIDETVLAYSVFYCTALQLQNSARTIGANNLNFINCSYRDNHFNINLSTRGTEAYARKCVNAVLKCMAVDKLYSIYDREIRMLKGKAGSKPRFNHACNVMHAGMAGIKIAIAGKINLKRKKEGKAIPVSTTMAKFVKSFKTKNIDDFKKLSHKGWEPYVGDDIPSACAVSPHVELKYPQLGLLIVRSYIKKLVKLPVSITNDSLLVYTDRWDGYRKFLQDKKRMKAFINSSYMHAAAKPEYLVFEAITSGFSAPFAKKIASIKLTTDFIVKLVDLK